MRPFDLSLPIHVVSEANERGDWHAGAKRTREHRNLVRLALRTIPRPPSTLPLVVTLERVAPLPLDDDNLARGLKAVRDEVACWARPVVIREGKKRGQITGDDRDPSVTWRAVQRRGKPREYALGIHVRPWSLACPGGRVRPAVDRDVVELVLTPAQRAAFVRALLSGATANVAVPGVELLLLPAPATPAPRSP